MEVAAEHGDNGSLVEKTGMIIVVNFYDDLGWSQELEWDIN